ncbi:hypothetical protein [Paenibacillus maysiensis]|uniref:hypothetical protein n=1 Tax=Paenibacillus maysiensis TaxID=1155954 RepID=UPI00046ED446|nr:hypothetical protein [Paenibacillus maysiensis]
MSTEASAVRNGGYAYLDRFRILHIESTQEAAETKSEYGTAIKFEGQHAYGHPVIPASGDEYEQLAVTVHADGSLTEKDGFAIPAHVKAAALALK